MKIFNWKILVNTKAYFYTYIMIQRVIISLSLFSLSSFGFDRAKLDQELSLITKPTPIEKIQKPKNEVKFKKEGQSNKSVFSEDLEAKYFDHLKIRQAAPKVDKKRKVRARWH